MKYLQHQSHDTFEAQPVWDTLATHEGANDWRRTTYVAIFGPCPDTTKAPTSYNIRICKDQDIQLTVPSMGFLPVCYFIGCTGYLQQSDFTTWNRGSMDGISPSVNSDLKPTTQDANDVSDISFIGRNLMHGSSQTRVEETENAQQVAEWVKELTIFQWSDEGRKHWNTKRIF